MAMLFTAFTRSSDPESKIEMKNSNSAEMNPDSQSLIAIETAQIKRYGERGLHN